MELSMICTIVHLDIFLFFVFGYYIFFNSSFFIYFYYKHTLNVLNPLNVTHTAVLTLKLP